MMSLRHLRPLLAVGILLGCGDTVIAPSPDAGITLCVTDDDCSDDLFCNGVETCAPASPLASRSGCVPSASPCSVAEDCNESADMCISACVDADGDGRRSAACGGDDCDDSDPNRFPGNTEVCDDDAHDEDCDDTTFGARDFDGDGSVDAACCNGTLCAGDCVDTMASIHPGATETCDGRDEDCDRAIDEGLVRPQFTDADGDLHGDASAPSLSCPGWARTSVTNVDCDDADARVHGLQPESCDGVDNDCDGHIDEQTVELRWYPDSDSDGFGDPAGTTMTSCAPPAGHALLPLDCDDGDAGRSPGAVELCNGIDDDCDGFANFMIGPGDLEDNDLDGHPDIACSGGTDCDDNDPYTGPGMYELCDGVDNDCDGMVDETPTGPEPTWYQDADGDGVGGALASITGCERPSGTFVTTSGDCGDDDASERPNAIEICDGRDQDCDGRIDEGAATIQAYADTDGDGFGTGEPTLVCALSGGQAPAPGDCDDANPSAFPGAPELCNDADDDCDGDTDEMAQFVDWYLDVDGDGAGDPGSTPISSCAPISGRVPNADDCNDGNQGVRPGATETCDGEDDDCDGPIDEGVATTYFNDADGDGVGNDGLTMTVCGAAPAGYVSLGGDCDDGDSTRSPLREETCDMVDEDCDNRVDEGATLAACVGPGYTGTCAPAAECECQTDLGDCNGTTADGCESDSMTDPDHCGGCGQRCGIGDECTSGACDGDAIIGFALGTRSSCVLRSNGNVACSGTDYFDSFLSPDAGLIHHAPVMVPITAEAITSHGYSTGGISVRSHRCVIQDSGATLRCWGFAADGSLGDGTTDEPLRGQTALVATPAGATYAQVIAGGRMTCARRTTGEVDCWGKNDDGRLGVGDTAEHLTPTQVVGFDDATHLSVGTSSACVARASGAVACWGLESERLGDRGASPIAHQANDLVDISGAVEVAVGVNHACARLAGGTVRCWGNDGDGQLGDGTLEPDRALSAEVVNISTAQQIVASANFACALLGDDRVACWGDDDNGQVGDGGGTAEGQPVPQTVVDTTGAPIRATVVATGGRDYACAALTDGGAVCWGEESHHQFGNGLQAANMFDTAQRMELIDAGP